MGASILVLQEVSNLCAGRRLNGGVLYGARRSSSSPSVNSVGVCDCGIVIPTFLFSAVPDFQCGRCWCGVALRNGLIILSVHFLWGKYDNTDDIIGDIALFVSQIREEFTGLYHMRF